MIRALANGYRAEVVMLDAAAWRQSARAFSDASLYQLWHHASPPERFARVNHLLLRRDEQLVAAAEIRLFSVPLTHIGIAYVRWGPLWRRPGHDHDAEQFRQAIRALRNEYVERRGMVLRINPRLFLEQHRDCVAMLEAEGFEAMTTRGSRRTLVMDLTPDIEVLRAGLDKKWRNGLSKAERGAHTVVMGTGTELFDEFRTIYDSMLERKQFSPTADIGRHRQMQTSLPDALKMIVVIVRHEGQACAGAICSAIGDTALYLFGAINETGMRTSGSNLAQWELLKHLKERGVCSYDLHGINAETNPGVYHFKKGLAGKHTPESTFASQSQAYEPSVFTSATLWAEDLRHRRRARRPAAPPRPSVAVAASEPIKDTH